MAAEKVRQQQNRTVSATSQTDKQLVGQNANEARAGVTRWMRLQVSELLGAVEDHKKWINSDRARALGTTFEVSGRLFAYAAYVALAYLTYKSFLGIRSGLSTGVYTIPEYVGGSRVALFNILATGLVGPIAIIAIAFGIGWIYNLTIAATNRALPRFAQPLVHPSILLAVATAYAAFHSGVSETVAKGYLYARANIEAASPQEAVSIKVIEIPGSDAPSVAEATVQDSSGERELVRLRSMFYSGRPCTKGGQGTELKPQPEVERPEPGFAPSQNCQAENTAQHK
jgi:hypothetical protein